MAAQTSLAEALIDKLFAHKSSQQRALCLSTCPALTAEDVAYIEETQELIEMAQRLLVVGAARLQQKPLEYHMVRAIIDANRDLCHQAVKRGFYNWDDVKFVSVTAFEAVYDSTACLPWATARWIGQPNDVPENAHSTIQDNGTFPSFPTERDDFSTMVLVGPSGSGKSVALLGSKSIYAQKTLGVYMKVGQNELHWDRAFSFGREERNRKVVDYVESTVGKWLRGAAEAAGVKWDKEKVQVVEGSTLILGFDECGRCPNFLRGLLATAGQIVQRLKTAWGFCRVYLVAAGTGAEGPVLAPGSDPTTYKTSKLKAATRDEIWSIMDKLKINPSVRKLATDNLHVEMLTKNRRAAFYFAVALATAAKEFEDEPQLLEEAIRYSMLNAAVHFRRANAIGQIKKEETVRFLAAMLSAVMIERSASSPVESKPEVFDEAARCGLMTDEGKRENAALVNEELFHALRADSDGTRIVWPKGTARFQTMPAIVWMLQSIMGPLRDVVQSDGESLEGAMLRFLPTAYFACVGHRSEFITCQAYSALVAQGCSEDRPFRIMNISVDDEEADRQLCEQHPRLLKAVANDGVPLPKGGFARVTPRHRITTLLGGSPKLTSKQSDHQAELLEHISKCIDGNRVVALDDGGLKTPYADITLLLRGYGVILIQCKNYFLTSANQIDFAKELRKMGLVNPLEVQESKAVNRGRLTTEKLLSLSRCSAPGHIDVLFVLINPSHCELNGFQLKDNPDVEVTVRELTVGERLENLFPTGTQMRASAGPRMQECLMPAEPSGQVCKRARED